MKGGNENEGNKKMKTKERKRKTMLLVMKTRGYKKIPDKMKQNTHPISKEIRQPKKREKSGSRQNLKKENLKPIKNEREKRKG